MTQDTPVTLIAPWLSPFGSQEVSRIFLKNYVVDMSIGAHAAEKTRRQRLIVNVDLYVAARRSPEDDLATVLDYDFMRQQVEKLAAERHWNLQETFCEKVMEICLAKPQVLAARVATEKPDVYPDCESVGYEIFRMRY